MDIRPARKADTRRLAELWAHAFPGERTVEQRVRQLDAGGVYGGIETAWIAVEGDDTAAAFRAYRLQQHMHGASMPMMGVAAVAVAAHARRRGLGAEICRTALRHGYDRGDVLSALYPFRPSFYEDLGYGLVGVLHSHRFRPELLPVTHQHPRVRLVSDAALLIRSAYDAVATRSNGMISRNDRIWRQHLDWPDVHAFALERGGTCAGYLIVQYGSAASAEDKPLTIRELVAVDDDAYNELLSWISLQRDAWRVIQYDALPSERLDLRLIDPRAPRHVPARTLFAPVATVLRGPMLRVLNVRKAIEMRRHWGVADASFTINVADRELPENSGVIRVALSNGRAEIEDAGIAGETHLETSASTFAQIYAGELSPVEAVLLGRAVLSGDTAMMKAVFRTTPEFCLLDEF